MSLERITLHGYEDLPVPVYLHYKTFKSSLNTVQKIRGCSCKAWQLWSVRLGVSEKRKTNCSTANWQISQCSSSNGARGMGGTLNLAVTIEWRSFKWETKKNVVKGAGGGGQGNTGYSSMQLGGN